MWAVIGIAAMAVAVGGTLAVRNANGDSAKKQAADSTKVAKQNGTKKKKNGKGGAAEAPVAPVELTEARTGSMHTWLQTTAVLEARNAATLVARHGGQVIELLCEEGDWAQAGAPLARLDDREARLAVEKAEVAAEVAKREMDRAQELASRGFLSEKEQDDLALKLRTAQVELEQARHDLSLTRIAAPFSGRVVTRSIQLGEMVTEGKACFELADFHRLRARVYFPERDLARVRVGQEAELTFDAVPGRPHVARVALVNPVVDRSNGTFKVTLELPNAGGALRPGAFARVRLRTGRFDGALLVPRRGILSEDGETYCYVARGDSAVRVPVRLGATDDDTAQIVAGLAAGDRIVTVGQGGLRSGAKIKPVRL
jgi:RND family efflux transporter MFP subunit